MGQCMSRKAAGAFAASAAASHSRPTKMHKTKQSPDDENNKDLTKKLPSQNLKGAAMSFGFKRRPQTAPSIASNSNVARRLANNENLIDRNGNGEADIEPLTNNIVPIGRTTPKLMPPKKEGIATKVNRFGFRQPQINRHDRVADLNAPFEFNNNNNNNNNHNNYNNNNNNAPTTTVRLRQNHILTSTTLPNRMRNGIVQVNDMNNRQKNKSPITTLQQTGKYTLQTTQLPQPMAIRMIETKTAKTLANNSKKNASTTYHEDNSSSKDGSLTEDSGVGSNISGNITEPDNIVRGGITHLSNSPKYGIRNHNRSRNLEMIVSGNTFDVRDFDEETSDNCIIPLPQLPSAFVSSVRDNNNKKGFPKSGFVKERTIEYQRHLNNNNNNNNNKRKISITSSEGFSDDFDDEEKTFFINENVFIKTTPSTTTTTTTKTHKTFLKTNKYESLNNDFSPHSSDEHEWIYGGEAMADDLNISLSSSDESKDKENIKEHYILPTNATINSALHTLINTSLTNSLTKSLLLTIEDPKFAAVAASTNVPLLDDEILPNDVCISFSETDDNFKHSQNTSNSKDINEKLTPSNPGTPTNISNSLSLSDGKDDFLIDDEIADQPALVFEDGGNVGGGTVAVASTTKNDDIFTSMSQNNSESLTMMESTPKSKRRILQNSFDGSPLLMRNKKFLQSRTESLDTLSPCESIASDDFMMDYEFSQSSGLDDHDRNEKSALHENSYNSNETIKDWRLINGSVSEKLKSTTSFQTTRLLNRSRTGTPTSSIVDSPKSLENRTIIKSKPLATTTNSPLRVSRQHLTYTNGYDSDDSIRLDRTNYTAVKQDIKSVKTMLLKLRRILNESDPHIPFDVLSNGLFNGLCSSTGDIAQNEDELAELRRQVLFLQGQLEDKEKVVQNLQDQMVKLTTEIYTSSSAPASTSTYEHITCNAATQTERIRPISAAPSLLNPSIDGNLIPLVSVSKTLSKKSNSSISSECPLLSNGKTQLRLWRKPGEPSLNTITSSLLSVSRRSNSQNRTPSTSS